MKTKILPEEGRSFFSLNFALPLLCFQRPVGSAALPALGGDRAGILAGRVTVRADPRGLPHLGGRPAMLIKSYNLHENDKAKT